MIPCIEMGERFRYLGKYFSFDMSPDKVKEELLLEITNLMGKIDRVSLHPHKNCELLVDMCTVKLGGNFQFTIFRAPG